MRKFIITSIIFITILVSACSIKENSIETLEPTEIRQKSSENYEVETIDFNIGERNIDDIDYTLKGVISIPKQSKQKKLKVAIIVPGYYKDTKRQDKGFKYLTEYIAKNGYLGISIDTDPAYYLGHTVDKEYENIPKIFDEHIKMLKEANEGHNIYNIDLENKIDFKHIAVISSAVSKEAIFKLTKDQSEKGVNILTLLLINPTNNKYNDFNIDNVKNISILVSELDEEVIGLDGFSIYNILKKCKNQNILSLTLLKNANHNYYLYVIKSNKRADLKALANYLNSGKLYFGNEVELNKYLGLKPGAVSLLGIINDSGKVKIIIDSDLVGKRLLMHPNINTVTLSIAYDNVLKIIEDRKNDYIIF